MATTPSEQPLSWADLTRWAEAGLITPEQVAAIRSFAASSEGAAPQPDPGPERRRGLSLVMVAYYFGAFMILLAYTFFMGLQWMSLGTTGQLAVTGGTIIGLGAVGALLRRAGYRVAGGLLIFVATGIVPLLVYTLQRWLGLWPDASLQYADFYNLIRPNWLAMEVVSIVAALLVVRVTRFPLVVLLIAFWGWYLSMDLAHWVGGAPMWEMGDREQAVGVAVGALMLVLGVVLQRRARLDYALWLYIFGHLAVMGHLSVLAFQYEGLLGLLFIATYLGFVVASVVLQRRVFLVFGAIGCYSYTSYLAFRVFEGSLGFTFALAAVGLLVLLSAVGYQRYIQGWLERRIGGLRHAPLAG